MLRDVKVIGRKWKCDGKVIGSGIGRKDAGGGGQVYVYMCICMCVYGWLVITSVNGVA